MLRKNLFFTVVLVLVVLVSQLSYGQGIWIGFTSPSESKPVFDLQCSTIETVSFSVEITGMKVRDINYQGQDFKRLAIPDHRAYTKVGFPEVPVVSQLIAIPDCEGVNISVCPTDSIELGGYLVYPVPDLIERYSLDGYVYLDEEFAINDSVYSLDSYFPNTPGEIAELGSIREQRIARVVIYPIQFNPVTNRLKIYFHLTVELNFLSPTSAVVKNVGPFYKACRATILNYLLVHLTGTPKICIL
jgi:hypothetical protein